MNICCNLPQIPDPVLKMPVSRMTVHAWLSLPDDRRRALHLFRFDGWETDPGVPRFFRLVRERAERAAPWSCIEDVASAALEDF